MIRIAVSSADFVMRRVLRLSGVVIATIFLLTACHPPAPFARTHEGTAEWTRFRGPNGSGLGKAPNLPAEFSASDFNWRIELPGAGHSSPVVWGNRVFVTANPHGTTQRIVVCIDAQDGKTLWTKTYESPSYHLNADNNYAASSPAVDAERVYFHWASPKDSGLVALDQDDGHELWKLDLGPFVSQDGPGTSPIVFEDMVILNFDQDRPKSFILAVDAKTGKQRWRWEHKGNMNTPGDALRLLSQAGRTANPSPDFYPGSQLDRCPHRQAGVADPRLDAKTLRRLTHCHRWRADRGAMREGRAETFVEVVRPAADGKSAQKAYEVVRVGAHVPTPIAVNGLLFLWKENGFVTCLRAETNEQLWSERAQGSFYGSPVCVNDRLYNMSTRGDLLVVRRGG